VIIIFKIPSGAIFCTIPFFTISVSGCHNSVFIITWFKPYARLSIIYLVEGRLHYLNYHAHETSAEFINKPYKIWHNNFRFTIECLIGHIVQK
jgi:hypothetical protein